MAVKNDMSLEEVRVLVYLSQGIMVAGQEELERMMVTPREVDTLVADIGRVTGCAISLALQEGLALADLELLLS